MVPHHVSPVTQTHTTIKPQFAEQLLMSELRWGIDSMTWQVNATLNVWRDNLDEIPAVGSAA